MRTSLRSVEVREGFRVRETAMEDDRVCGVKGSRPGGDEETLRARITIGADGRNSIVARGLGVFRWHPSHRRLALGRHYEGVQPGRRELEIYGGRSLYGILNHQGDGAVNVSLVLKETNLRIMEGETGRLV